MSHKNWQQIKEVFHEALRHEGEAREEYLDNVCSGDIEFRVEVESLLISLAEAQTFLEQPVVGAVPPHPAWQFESGRQISHYKIVSPIGVGGMGEVYLAHDLKLNRRVALKVLSSSMTTDRDRLRRFQREAEVVSALNHPNILTIFEFDTDGDLQLFAGEYVKGETLRERIKRGPIPVPEALDIAIQTVSALQAAHEAHVIHRDIKPENIMIRDDGYVKILDFGLAKLSRPPEENESAETRPQIFSRPGMIMGTTAYMSPEQARGRVIDARTDIFSFGVVLYEMLTGKALFSGDTATDVIAAIIQTEPPPVSEIADDLPAGFDPILANALEKDRNNRYQTAAELLADLKDLKRRIESGEPVEAVHPDTGEKTTEIFFAPPTQENNVRTARSPRYTALIAAIIALLVLAGLGLAYWYYGRSAAGASEINSIAVLPFENQSGDVDAEYLSDGMTETLIGKLAKLPNLSVKARSSVFRYKGTNIEPRIIGRELAVQAVLMGRVVQRNDQLSLFLELVDVSTGDQVWSEQYHRKQADIVRLQSDIALDVSNKLRRRLSKADELIVTKNFTENAEAYQLYLKGRFHTIKVTRDELSKAIPYFEQAIALDPNFALAYVGLADAYRGLPLGGEQRPADYFPKAKTAALKAIELDDTLAEAHAVLGWIIYWYDWDWSEAENQCRKALELDPNSGDVHMAYAHILSGLGRHDEAIAEARRATELEPLNLRTNTLEAQFLIHAGKPDEALLVLKKSLELDPEYWFAYQFTASAYIDKGMYHEAVLAARKGREVYPDNSRNVSFLAYALAKDGKQAEARKELQEMLKPQDDRFIPTYNIAMVYNGLGERDETLAWLERGLQNRDPRMTFLKADRKWDNLRGDPRFQDIMRRVGFPQ